MNARSNEMAATQRRMRKRRHWRHELRRQRRALEWRLESEEIDGQDSILKLFECPEPGCIASFFNLANLHNHMDMGKHRYEPTHQTMWDYALGQYQAQLEKENKAPLKDFSEKQLWLRNFQSKHATMPMGWALPPTPEVVRFTPAQKQFLVDIFDEESKQNPYTIADRMKAHWPNNAELWLKPRQILGFMGRLARNRKTTSARDCKKRPEPEVCASAAEKAAIVPLEESYLEPEREHLVSIAPLSNIKLHQCDSNFFQDELQHETWEEQVRAEAKDAL